MSNKVPEVTFVFWIIKIAAMTLAETGGDTVTMTLNCGDLAGTALFAAILVALVAVQIWELESRAGRNYQPATSVMINTNSLILFRFRGATADIAAYAVGRLSVENKPKQIIIR